VAAAVRRTRTPPPDPSSFLPFSEVRASRMLVDVRAFPIVPPTEAPQGVKVRVVNSGGGGRMPVSRSRGILRNKPQDPTEPPFLLPPPSPLPPPPPLRHPPGPPPLPRLRPRDGVRSRRSSHRARRHRFSNQPRPPASSAPATTRSLTRRRRLRLRRRRCLRCSVV
jgi:hypothetical protein